MGLFNWREDSIKKEFLKFHKVSRRSLRNNAHELLDILRSKYKNSIKILHLRNLLKIMDDLETRIFEAQKRFKNERVDMHVFIKLRQEFDSVTNKINEEIKKLERNKN